MSEIQIVKDSKLIKVLAAQVKGQRVESSDAEQISSIMKELAEDNSPKARHELAQTMAFTLTDLQEHEIDFLNPIADIKNIGFGDKAAFNVKLGTVHAYQQAQDATVARSFVAGKQVNVDTINIACRPAINRYDILCGRVNMADLIKDANREMTNMKLKYIENALQAAVTTYSTPFYATSAGPVKATLDAQIAYFRRLGPVTILGDIAAVSKLAPLVGMQMNAGTNTDAFTQRPDAYVTEFNENGFIGRYNGCDVIALQNALEYGKTTTVMDTDWLYIIPGGLSADARNLKVVNEGTVQSFESQNIDDVVYEIRLDQRFGAKFVVGTQPTIGGHLIS